MAFVSLATGLVIGDMHWLYNWLKDERIWRVQCVRNKNVYKLYTLYHYNDQTCFPCSNHEKKISSVQQYLFTLQLLQPIVLANQGNITS